MKALTCVAMLTLATTLSASATVIRATWGTTAAGQQVSLYTLTEGKLTVRLSTLGAGIVAIETPDRHGKLADITLGFDDLKSYETDTNWFGPIVGRFGNRIAKGTFTLDGKTYHLPINNGANSLHGGPQGFSTKVWTAHQIPNGVEMTLLSPDGDSGYPGALTAHVAYTLHANTLHIDISATSTAPTIVNLTSHTYWNLAGGGNVLKQILQVDADRYTPVDATLIPTGQLAPVAGTPFDFRKPTALGDYLTPANLDADNPANDQFKFGKGYDHNFALNQASAPGLHPALTLYDPVSGRQIAFATTEPGLQFYGGGGFDGSVTGKHGVPYQQYAGVVFETQHFPDSPNQPTFPLNRPSPRPHRERPHRHHLHHTSITGESPPGSRLQDPPSDALPQMNHPANLHQHPRSQHQRHRNHRQQQSADAHNKQPIPRPMLLFAPRGPRQQRIIPPIRPPSDVKQISYHRQRPRRRLDRHVQHHPRHHHVRHPTRPRRHNDDRRGEPTQHVPNPRNKSDDAVQSKPDRRPGNPDKVVEQMRQHIHMLVVEQLARRLRPRP